MRYWVPVQLLVEAQSPTVAYGRAGGAMHGLLFAARRTDPAFPIMEVVVYNEQHITIAHPDSVRSGVKA